MYNMSLPWWGWALMAAGFVCFVLMVALSVRRHHGVKRSLFASPYTLWMIIFTVLPCILVAYYAFTDANGAFTLDNFRHFWDSNYTKNQLYAQMGPEAAALRALAAASASLASSGLAAAAFSALTAAFSS